MLGRNGPAPLRGSGPRSWFRWRSGFTPADVADWASTTEARRRRPGRLRARGHATAARRCTSATSRPAWPRSSGPGGRHRVPRVRPWSSRRDGRGRRVGERRLRRGRCLRGGDRGPRRGRARATRRTASATTTPSRSGSPAAGSSRSSSSASTGRPGPSSPGLARSIEQHEPVAVATVVRGPTGLGRHLLVRPDGVEGSPRAPTASTRRSPTTPWACSGRAPRASSGTAPTGSASRARSRSSSSPTPRRRG